MAEPWCLALPDFSGNSPSRVEKRSVIYHGEAQEEPVFSPHGKELAFVLTEHGMCSLLLLAPLFANAAVLGLAFVKGVRRNACERSASKGTVTGVQFLMRRLLAHLALATIVGPLLGPLAIALQTSATPACCLPGGKHHCRQTPNGQGANSQTDKCPYASLAMATQVNAVAAAQFGLAKPEVIGYFGPITPRSGYRFADRELSARGPPVLHL
jgi:hypothetical protein